LGSQTPDTGPYPQGKRRGRGKGRLRSARARAPARRTRAPPQPSPAPAPGPAPTHPPRTLSRPAPVLAAPLTASARAAPPCLRGAAMAGAAEGCSHVHVPEVQVALVRQRRRLCRVVVARHNQNTSPLRRPVPRAPFRRTCPASRTQGRLGVRRGSAAVRGAGANPAMLACLKTSPERSTPGPFPYLHSRKRWDPRVAARGRGRGGR